MNRRTFLTAAPIAAAATWTVTCKYKEPEKEEKKTARFHIEYYYVTATYWDDEQMLQNAIVDDCDLSGRHFHDVQNSCDNIHDHNKKYFEKYPSDQMVDYQIWYHGFDDSHSMVGELTLGKNGVNTFVKQWVMNDNQIADMKKEHKNRKV
jgi:hypothetical protein